MYTTLVQSGINQQRLTQVVVWCIGEFGDLLVANKNSQESVSEKDVTDIMERILKSPITSSVTKGFVLTSLMKLSSRFSNSNTEIQNLISYYQNNLNVELQQRSCEYLKIFKWDNIRKSLLERIPVVEDKSKQGSTSEISPTVLSTKKEKSIIDFEEEILGKPQNISQPAATVDLLSELFGPSETTNVPINSTNVTKVNTTLDPLESIFGTPQVSAPSVAASIPPITAYQKNGLTIIFDLARQASTPNTTSVKASFSNSLNLPITNFEFKAAVPKYIKLQVFPPSGNIIPPLNTGKVTQSLSMVNSLHGEKPLLLKIKIDYILNGAPMSDIGDVPLP